MTTLTASAAPAKPSLLRQVAGIVAWPFLAIAEANTRVHEYETLSRMSDASLAKRGLTRDMLPAHVCRDL